MLKISHSHCIIIKEVWRRPRKRLFVSCHGPKRNRVGRSVKHIYTCIYLYYYYFFVQKCVFYACLMLIGSWEGVKF